MYAKILIREHGVALAHNKPPKRPVPFADRELSAPGVLDLIEATNGYFNVTHFASSSFQGATFINNNIPGTASAVQRK